MQSYSSSKSSMLAVVILIQFTHLLFLICGALAQNEYQIKNDRILAPEVTHFVRPAEPGVDSHGDLSLAIPLMTVPGRGGLDFSITAQYRSGIQVTQSASWIGLGWELDLGSITRHALGGVQGHKQADFAHALNDDGTEKIEAQPDVYAINMNGSSVLLLSMTKESSPNIPFEPANSETSGPCSDSSLYSQWFFITSPWKPWKFCYATSGSNSVTVDGKSTGINHAADRRDFTKFIVTTEDGTRYVYSGANDLPTLSHAYFPQLSYPYNETSYTFASTWRLRAILAPNYSGPEVPNNTSTGGWIKIGYKTWDREEDTPEYVDTVAGSSGRIIAQMTYPYYVETPTHFAFFQTSKRYDRNLASPVPNISPPSGNGVDDNYYHRKLDKITLYKKQEEAFGKPLTEPASGAVLNPENAGTVVMQVSFKYMATGADELSSYIESDPDSPHKKMLSRLALEKITTKGLAGSAPDSLPAYKFTYYDDVALSWHYVNDAAQRQLHWYQDDFGYLEIPASDPNYGSGPPTRGWMWSLKQITYPEGGRRVITYANDSLASQSLSYKKYLLNTSYSQENGSFERAEQGGARVQSIATYDGYNDSAPDIVNYSYGPGRHSAISETYFRKLDEHKDLPLYYLGERGQANVTYDWVKQKFPNNSAIKTSYFTGGASHNPEPQILYNGGGRIALLQGNKNWNWGEKTRMEYLNSSNTKVKEEIYSWMFEGDYTDASPLILATVVPRLPYTNGTPDSLYIHFTHKQLDTLVTNTFYDSEVVTKTDLFSYFDGTLVRTHTERADDSAERTTGYVYAFRTTNAAPYSGMRTKNLRSQLARVSLFREPNPNTKYGFWSTATTWKEIDGIYLPDQEYKWRHEFFEGQFPAFSWHPDSVGEGDQDWILTTSFTSYDTHGNLTTVKDAYNVSTTIDWDATGTLIDSITTRPNATTNLVTHYDYDDNTFRLISITDPNEKMVNFKYDALQRLIEIIAPDKSTTGRLSYYYSRAFNSDTLSITNPNYVESTLTSGNAFFDAFEYTDAPENHGWAEYLGASNGVMSTVYDASLQSRVLRTEATSGANDSYAIKYPASGHLGAFQSRVSVKVKNSQSSSSFRVVVWYANNEYTIVYKFNDGTNSYDSGSRTLNIFAGAAFKDGSWRILERDLLADFRLTGIQADFEYIRRIIVRGEYDLDDVLTDVPATTVTYADGLGRSIQTAQYDYEGAVKAATVYDFADRVTRAYKPFTSSDRSFTPAFHDSTNAYYTTKFFPYYPNPSTDTSPYSYSETTYLNDPLNRIDKQGFPGNAFRIGSGREIKFAYLTNAGEEVNHFGASLHKVRRRNENGVYLNTFQDSFGRFVVQRVDTANFNYKTEFAYDLADRLFQTHHPNGTSTAAVYDTWSQLLSLNSPDAGTIYYLYDKKGRLRFVKDGKGAEEGYFIYYKYDDLNRKIEEGTVSGLTAFQQDNADIRDFPTSTTHTVKVKYHYDAAAYYPSTTQRNLKGRLEAIEYLTERYSLPGYMFYSYDDNGNIEWLEQHIPKSNTADGNAYLSVKISYEYDAAGKIMKTHYRRIFPPGAGSDAFFIWYEYDALARLARVFTNTSDARPNAANAEYLTGPTANCAA